MDYAIKIEGVWKSYTARTAVQGLDLSVPTGSVYGFLGPNGAGKSTTIRMILGLQRPDRGSISLFGRSMETNRQALLRRIGSLVEAPSLYLHLTGRENLEIHRRLLDVPKKAITEALDIVTLTSACERVVRGYSSGMKQRLGIAQALLGEPDLLILDEPTNGLDPGGIHEIRSLIKDLPKRRGVTIFLSSHLLAEVEQVGTHFAIISEGKLKFEGTADELKRRNQPMIVAEVNDVERATSMLSRVGISFRVEDRQITILPHATYGSTEINSLLVRGGVGVAQLIVRHVTLEDTFLELTSTPMQVEELVRAS